MSSQRKKRKSALLINVRDAHPRLHCDRVEHLSIPDGTAKLLLRNKLRNYLRKNPKSNRNKSQIAIKQKSNRNI